MLFRFAAVKKFIVFVGRSIPVLGMLCVPPDKDDEFLLQFPGAKGN
jgi:hypothetical protein